MNPRPTAGEIAPRERGLGDLLFVPTSWGYEQQWNAAELAPYACEMGAQLGWDEARAEQETGAVLCQTTPGRS